MADSPLFRLLDGARRHLLGRGARPAPDAERRQFFRRAGVGAAALGTGLLLPDEAWAGAQERADRFGITPGTVVDAKGRPVRNPSGVEPFLGEIMMVGWNFAARGYEFCNGQLIAISSNTALFALLGTTFGGNGVQTFGLPDLRGRSPMHFGQGSGLTNRTLGERAGTEQTTLTVQNLAAHAHPHDHTQPVSTEAGTVRGPNGNVPARDPDANYFPTATAGAAFLPTSQDATMTGSSLPFSNMPPYLVINFQIATQGIFPSRQ